MKKEGSLPPPPVTKPEMKKSEPEVIKDNDVAKKIESSPVTEVTSKVDISTPATKEKPPVKTRTTPNRTTSSPNKEIKKEKSPIKEPTPKRDVPMKRDVTTVKRISPSKEQPKAVNITIKKPFTTATTPKRGVETPHIEQPKTSEKKKEMVTKLSSPNYESSDSSDSESEAERLLRQLSERRERIEAAKKEKLRKVSQQQEEAKNASNARDRIDRPCLKKDGTSEEKSLPPLETPSDTPDDMIPVKPVCIPKASMISDAEQPLASKFATLPRGFKSRGIEKPTPHQVK